MTRIVDLANTGVVVIMAGGRIIEVAGRTHWETVDEARRALAAAGKPPAEDIRGTGRKFA